MAIKITRTVPPVKPINPVAKQVAENRQQFQTKAKPSKKAYSRPSQKKLLLDE